MDFKKANAAAKTLRETAHYVNRFSNNESDYIQSNIRKGFEGENASILEMKNMHLFATVNSIAKDLNNVSDCIQVKALKIKTAEMRAIAIAKNKENK